MKPYLTIKRIIDFILSVIALIFLIPLFIIIGVAIKLESKGPIFYKQTRVGKNEKEFKIYKFRTMIDKAEFKGKGLYFDGENDPRITKVGKILRKTSVDEIPQIINIILGDMSIIGPRPMIIPLYDKLNKEQRLRSRVLPGITGLAQVNGRNSIPWSKRIELDNEYCDNIGLIMDIKIFFKTIKVVFLKENIRYDQDVYEIDDLGM